MIWKNEALLSRQAQKNHANSRARFFRAMQSKLDNTEGFTDVAYTPNQLRIFDEQEFIPATDIAMVAALTQHKEKSSPFLYDICNMARMQIVQLLNHIGESILDALAQPSALINLPALKGNSSSSPSSIMPCSRSPEPTSMVFTTGSSAYGDAPRVEDESRLATCKKRG